MIRSIPVLYYHRIGTPDPEHLSTSTAAFQKQMQFLVARGYRTLHCRDLADHLSGKAVITRPAAMVTFDDGFRDNLTEALPILEGLGLKAVLFQSSGLIRPESAPASPVYRGFNQAHTAARRGDFGDFLSRAELHAMKRMGLIEIQSHGHAHAQVFTSSTITGWYPESDQHWGILSAYGSGLESGVWPVFRRGPGLVNRAFLPNQTALEAWMKQGITERPKVAASGWLEQESERAFSERVGEDLSRARKELSEFSPEGGSFLCWPWGAHSDSSTRIARESGYQGAFLTSSGANVPGTDPFKVSRYAIRSSSLPKFAFGVWLRGHPVLAKIYGMLHGRI